MIVLKFTAKSETFLYDVSCRWEHTRYDGMQMTIAEFAIIREIVVWVSTVKQKT